MGAPIPAEPPSRPAATETMRRPDIVRVALLAIVAYCLFIGLTAAVIPHVFYDDFPFLEHWVERLPPYNEHLVFDVGGLYLGFAVVLGLAAWRPRRDLVIAACAGFLTMAVPHLAFHATHLSGFGTGGAIAELGALASLLIPPVLAIWASAAAEPGP
ncbi:MAG: hypothetical protein JWO14_3763 [Solirubrobacterales bacterium]|nr:hypothetical protein [Solirubrobacterales bacterium]